MLIHKYTLINIHSTLYSTKFTLLAFVMTIYDETKVYINFFLKNVNLEWYVCNQFLIILMV